MRIWAYLLLMLWAVKGGRQEGSKDNSNGGHKLKDLPSHIQISFTLEHEEQERAFREKQHALQKSSNRAVWWTFWAVLIYAGLTLAMFFVTKKSADAAKESADAARDSFNMAKRHTENSDEAILQPVTLSLEPDQNVGTIVLMNTGQVTAHNITAHLEIWRTSLLNNHREKLLGTADFSQEELRKNDNIRRQVVLPDFGKLDRDRMLALKEGISFDFAVAYENGFDTRRNPKGCLTQVIKTPNPGDSPQTPYGILMPCDNVPAWLVNERIVHQRFLDQTKAK
jgi:hypothetical protein